ncbi:MAG: ATPase [Ruminococcaceae bacterium]|nr:ATPase [Oscillospiraceae bacterium]
MDIMEIINMMEETIEKAPVVPLSGKILIDKDEIMDYVQEMRLVFPDEVKEAKWVKGERQRILTEAESKAEGMIKSAEEEMVRMIDESEITRQAYEQANAMVNDAEARTAEMKSEFDQYVNDIMSDVERRLDMLLKKVQEDKLYFNNK